MQEAQLDRGPGLEVRCTARPPDPCTGGWTGVPGWRLGIRTALQTCVQVGICQEEMRDEETRDTEPKSSILLDKMICSDCLQGQHHSPIITKTKSSILLAKIVDSDRSPGGHPSPEGTKPESNILLSKLVYSHCSQGWQPPWPHVIQMPAWVYVVCTLLNKEV